MRRVCDPAPIPSMRRRRPHHPRRIAFIVRNLPCFINFGRGVVGGDVTRANFAFALLALRVLSPLYPVPQSQSSPVCGNDSVRVPMSCGITLKL